VVRVLAALGKVLATVAAGVVVGAVGTVMHRASPPWGLVGALALALAAAVTARAWDSWSTWLGYLAGLFATVQTLGQTGPGGDVLVPQGDAIGWVWVIGSLVLALAVVALPKRWFDDRPLPLRGGRHAAAP
jgi:hypothetical protein